MDSELMSRTSLKQDKTRQDTRQDKTKQETRQRTATCSFCLTHSPPLQPYLPQFPIPGLCCPGLVLQRIWVVTVQASDRGRAGIRAIGLGLGLDTPPFSTEFWGVVEKLHVGDPMQNADDPSLDVYGHNSFGITRVHIPLHHNISMKRISIILLLGSY
jgi:hypothetical protein